MAWIGLIGGIVVGALGWGWNGAVVLGFIGWLAGIIIGASRKPKAPAAARAVTMPETPATRIDRLERTVAALDARIARLESGAAIAPVTAAPPVPEPFVESVAQPISEPISEPIVEPAPVAAAAAQAGAPSMDPRLHGDDVPPPPPPKPSKPHFIVEWFTSGNAIVRVGALVLFVGLVFLLNYARERGLIAPEWRVAGVTLVAIALLAVGWRLRNKNSGYALSLQGAGVAVLYLTIFAAMRLYGLISHEAAFFLLAAVAVFSAFMAIAQDSLALAIIGAGGGFLAPILASTGRGDHVALFSYYLVLNAGIVAIAWFKAWRSLNVVGFLFTALIGFAWGERFYRPELFGSTEPFLVIFFLLYVAIAILFARASSSALPPASDASSPAFPPGSSGRGPIALVDGTIVFGTPLAAFALQAGIVKGIEFALAYSSVIAAALYVGLAVALRGLKSERWTLLAESFLALGVVFASLAIPLALDARWTSAAWALEGAAIVWVGIRQGRTLARAFGLLLQVGGGIAYLFAYSRMPAGMPLFDAPFIGALLVAFAGLWTNRLISANPDRVTSAERGLAPFAFLWGFGWFLFAGHHEVEVYLPRSARLSAHAALFAATALGFSLLNRAWGWREARWPALALIPALWVLAFFAFTTQPHAFGQYGWLAWPFAIAIVFHLLKSLESAPLHTAAFLLVAALGAWELHWLAIQETAPHTAWSVASVLVVPAVLLLAATSRAFDTRWPVAPHADAYRMGGVFIILVAMAIWVLYANVTHDGRSDPLPYLPLLNAIDLGHLLIGICIMAAVLAWRRSSLAPPKPLDGVGGWVVIGALTFGWLNAIVLRTIHHWTDIPYERHAMTRSVLVQASLSVFWSVIALALMVYATRTARRSLWMVGASLMGIVVVKLFLVDFSHIAGIERIVSFIGVGVLMLVIGYFSPVPPRKAGEEA
jgi:uncharacterized membrane protein